MDLRIGTQFSIRDFLDFIFKRKAEILVFFFAAFGAVAIGTWIMRPTYEATAQIMVKIGRENLYIPTASGSGSHPAVNVSREEQVNSEIEILRSRLLAEEVIKALGPGAIYKDLADPLPGSFANLLSGSKARLSAVDTAVLRLEKNLAVAAVKKSSVIQVSYRNTDPKTAAAVVNSLVNHYLDRHLDVFKNPGSFTFFGEQSRLLKKKLAQAEADLKEFKERHDLTFLKEQLSLLLKQAAELHTATNQTESQVAATKTRLEQLRLQLAKVPQTIQQGDEVDHNAYLISSLQARLVDLELKQKELLGKYTDQNHLVKNVREDIAMVRAKLNEQENKRYGKSRSGLNATYQRLEGETFQNEAELKALLAREKTQRDQLAEHQVQLKKLNRTEVELSHLEREVEVNRQNYRLYLTKFEESRISNAMDSEKISNVSLIEPAQPPLRPVSPKVLLNLALGFVLAAVGGLGFAFFRESLDDSLEKPEQIEEILGLPVLASVPETPDPQRKRPVIGMETWHRFYHGRLRELIPVSIKDRCRLYRTKLRGLIPVVIKPQDRTT
jgi:uncharacterized protein involved in exopolysaccharide biosynthesis